MFYDYTSIQQNVVVKAAFCGPFPSRKLYPKKWCDKLSASMR